MRLNIVPLWKLLSLYHSPDDIRKIKQNGMIGVACIRESMEEMGYGNKCLVGKPERKRLFSRPTPRRCKFKGHFESGVKVIGGCGIQPPCSRTVQS